MYRIAAKRALHDTVTLMEIEAPYIAKKAKPGQFIILRVDENGERVPLTVAGTDPVRGTVTIIFQKVGYSTKRLDCLNEGDYILDFVGPLGVASHLDGMKKVAVVGGGLGVAIAYPQAKALHDMGAEVISSILNQAVFWQVIPDNPTRRVKPPKFERKEAKYLDEEQTSTLLRLLDNEPYQNQVMIRFFLLSGVRRGELCGLEWKDIDFNNHMITICRTSQYLPEKGIYTKSTKTDSSVRTIKLPEQAFELLKAHRKWQRKQRIVMGDRWVDCDRLFTQDDGTPVHPDSITGWFHDFISRTDLPQISIHSLRHTNITLLLAAGIPLKTVSYRAGHAQTSTTANIYSHAIRTADEKAAEVLEDIVKEARYSR